MHGIIALDIDGTLTANSHQIPKKVVEYLSTLVENGWRLIFITGRTYSSAQFSLKDLKFPYYLAIQNGALIMEMPSQAIFTKKYLDLSICLSMEEICKGEQSDFVVYGGYEQNDICYFRPHHFSQHLLGYLKERVKWFRETWISLNSFQEMNLKEFPSIKCFGMYKDAVHLANKIEQKLALHVPLIRDPFDENYYVIQATHAKINKGQALKDFLDMSHYSGKLIVAGDDFNDVSMLKLADIKIVMSTAPQEILNIADIIAPGATDGGIIVGLEAAIKH